MDKCHNGAKRQGLKSKKLSCKLHSLQQAAEQAVLVISCNREVRTVLNTSRYTLTLCSRTSPICETQSQKRTVHVENHDCKHQTSWYVPAVSQCDILQHWLGTGSHWDKPVTVQPAEAAHSLQNEAMRVTLQTTQNTSMAETMWYLLDLPPVETKLRWNKSTHTSVRCRISRIHSTMSRKKSVRCGLSRGKLSARHLTELKQTRDRGLSLCDFKLNCDWDCCQKTSSRHTLPWLNGRLKTNKTDGQTNKHRNCSKGVGKGSCRWSAVRCDELSVHPTLILRARYLGSLFRDGAKHLWTFPRATMSSLAENEAVLASYDNDIRKVFNHPPTKKKKKMCIDRESNPGHPRGRRVFYH